MDTANQAQHDVDNLDQRVRKILVELLNQAPIPEGLEGMPLAL